MSLSSEFAEATAGSPIDNIEPDDLETFGELLKDLPSKVVQGAYVVEAEKEGLLEWKAEGKYHDKTDLTVVLKPSKENSDTTIESMIFTFKHDSMIEGSPAQTTGTVSIGFSIKAENDKVYSHTRRRHEFPLSTPFLNEVRNIGLEKIRTDEWASLQAQKKARANDLRGALRL